MKTPAGNRRFVPAPTPSPSPVEGEGLGGEGVPHSSGSFDSEDQELNAIADARSGQKRVRVALDEL